MGTHLDFITQKHVDLAEAGKADAEVRRVADRIAACMHYPDNPEGRELFLVNAEIRFQLELLEGRKLTGKDAPALLELLERQREQPLSVPDLEERNKRCMLNGYARGLIFAQALEVGNAEAARRMVAAELTGDYDRNFRRQLYFNDVAHLWAAHRWFRSAEVIPCPPSHLPAFLAVARGYQAALEVVGGNAGAFGIPAGLKLRSRWEVQETGEPRKKNARFAPRHLVELSQSKAA